MSNRHPALDALVARRFDPSSGLEVLVAELRREGFTGSQEEAQLLAIAYRAIPEAWPPEIDPRLTMSRQQAARVLCRSVQRVDQLRRRGDLRFETRADQTVAINRGDVEARARRQRSPEVLRRLPPERRVS